MNKPDTLYTHRILQGGRPTNTYYPTPVSTNQNQFNLSTNQNRAPLATSSSSIFLSSQNPSVAVSQRNDRMLYPTDLEPLRPLPSRSPSNMFYPSNAKSFTSTYNTVVKPTSAEPCIINVPVGLNLNSVANKHDLSQIFSQVARINNHLYLCSLMAINPERLAQLRITLVVSAIGDKLPACVKAPGVANLHVIVEDVESANLKVHFERVAEQIYQEYQRGGRVLVHCMAGVSRSSSLILAYLMRYHNMTLARAYQMVKAARPYINPNRGFWKQLLEYEMQIHGEQTVNLVSASSHSRTRQFERNPAFQPTLSMSPHTATNLPIMRRPSISAGRRMYSYNGCLNGTNEPVTHTVYGSAKSIGPCSRIPGIGYLDQY